MDIYIILLLRIGINIGKRGGNCHHASRQFNCLASVEYQTYDGVFFHWSYRFSTDGIGWKLSFGTSSIIVLQRSVYDYELGRFWVNRFIRTKNRFSTTGELPRIR